MQRKVWVTHSPAGQPAVPRTQPQLVLPFPPPHSLPCAAQGGRHAAAASHRGHLTRQGVDLHWQVGGGRGLGQRTLVEPLPQVGGWACGWKHLPAILLAQRHFIYSCRRRIDMHDAVKMGLADHAADETGAEDVALNLARDIARVRLLATVLRLYR